MRHFLCIVMIKNFINEILSRIVISEAAQDFCESFNLPSLTRLKVKSKLHHRRCFQHPSEHRHPHKAPFRQSNLFVLPNSSMEPIQSAFSCESPTMYMS